MALAAWQIEPDGQPRRLGVGKVELEHLLEGWIEADPTLIEQGLLMVQRQLHVDGGILDLLCVDQQGRPTIIEVKRGKLIRETIAQAIDYASSVASMPLSELRAEIESYPGVSSSDHPGLAAFLDPGTAEEPREVAVVVVGVGQEPGLKRMIDFLSSSFAMPIRAVTFDVFDLGTGEQVLIREEAEPEVTAVPPSQAYSVERVIALAGGAESANGRRMKLILDAAEQLSLYVRPHKWSFMLAPPQNRTRFLVNVWKPGSKDQLVVSYSADAFAEFFPVEPETVRRTLGQDSAPVVIESDEATRAWIQRLRNLFAEIGSDVQTDSAHTMTRENEAVADG